MTTPALLFHYTSAEGLHSILTNRKLRLTNARYLNDSQEILQGLEIVRQVLAELQRECPHSAGDYRDLTDVLQPHRCNTYVACFSEDEDELSQWRAYADDGRGYAIGFCSTRLANFRPDISLTKVLYADAATSAVCAAQLEIAAMLRSHWLSAAATSSIPVLMLGKRLLDIVPWIKHPAFKREREWRLCLNSFWEAPTVFTPRGGILVPRIETPIARLSEDISNPNKPAPSTSPIVRITIGPRNNVALARLALEAFLKHLGYEGIEIAQSIAPYRSYNDAQQ